MKRIVAVILILSATFVAIAKQHKQRKRKPAQNEIMSLQMSRTPCYGACAVYTIGLKRNGTVTYTGVRNTPDTGTFEKSVGSEKASEILSEFEAYRVDTCHIVVKHPIEDLPSLNLVIQYKDSTKKLYNAQLGPSWLKTLTDNMDKEFIKKEVVGWHKINPSAKKLH